MGGVFIHILGMLCNLIGLMTIIFRKNYHFLGLLRFRDCFFLLLLEMLKRYKMEMLKGFLGLKKFHTKKKVIFLHLRSHYYFAILHFIIGYFINFQYITSRWFKNDRNLVCLCYLMNPSLISIYLSKILKSILSIILNLDISESRTSILIWNLILVG